MANTVRIKRRDSGGAAGAPSSLANAELAFNEADDTLYYGKGAGGAGGSATTIMAIGGPGAFVSLGSTTQTILGTKTFSGSLKAPTVSSGDNSTNVATTAYVKSQGYITSSGSVASAAKLTTARTISLSSDATGSASFDGSQNVSLAVTLANSGVSAGTYPKVTVDAKGRVTAGASLSVSDIPTLTASKISDFNTQVRLSGIDQMAEPESDMSFNDVRIMNLADPVSDTDAANKRYVDNAVQGLDTKASVKAATTSNITLSGAQTIDGVSVTAGDRVLVKDQSTASQNGIYVVSASTWSRAADANTWDELVSAFVFVEEGTVNGDGGFVCTADEGGTLGSTANAWTQFSGAGAVTAGSGLTKTGTQIDVGAGTGISVTADAVALTGQALAFHNLGTNGLAVRTSSGNVAARTITTSGSGVSVGNGDGVSGNPTISLTTALSTVGGLTPAADRIPYYTGASTASLATLTSFGRSLIDDSSASAARTTLGLVIGSDVQAHNSYLDTIAGLARTNGNFIVGNGTTWVVESGSTARASLGLGSIATQASSAVAITGGSITNLTTFDGITIDCGTF